MEESRRDLVVSNEGSIFACQIAMLCGVTLTILQPASTLVPETAMPSKAPVASEAVSAKFIVAEFAVSAKTGITPKAAMAKSLVAELRMAVKSVVGMRFRMGLVGRMSRIVVAGSATSEQHEPQYEDGL